MWKKSYIPYGSKKIFTQGLWMDRRRFPQGKNTPHFIPKHSTISCGKTGLFRRQGKLFLLLFLSRKRMPARRGHVYSYLALMLVVISLMISAFSGSVLTRPSIRFRALRTVL